MTEKTVWAVSRGSYSDYQVLYICDTEERATAVAAAYNAGLPNTYDEAYVEDFPFINGEFTAGTVLTMNAYLRPDGTAIPGVDQEESWVGAVGASIYRTRLGVVAGGQRLNLMVEGTDHERVRKSFSERLTQLASDDAYRAEMFRQVGLPRRP